MKTIAITGASGFVARTIKETLKNDFEFIDLRREDYKDSQTLGKKLNGVYGIFNLAGANISQKWTAEHKIAIYTSRIDTTKALTDAIKLCETKPEIFISTSAVGRYKEGASHDESSQDFSSEYLGDVTKDWENQALKAREFGVKTYIFRFGVVLGSGGGMLEKVLPPFKFGLGGPIGDGNFDFSWVHIKDLVGAYQYAVTKDLKEGVYNITAPNPVTNLEFTKALGKALHRPTFFPLPTFMLTLMFGEGSKVMTTGQRVYPKALEREGFTFSYPDIDSALEDIVT